MTAPASYARVLAALKRLSPSFPSLDSDKRAGKEMASIATMAGRIMDRFDAIGSELYPDTADALLDRWEAICRIPVRTTDSLATRRARVLGVLRRLSGPRLDQLELALSSPLGTSELIFVEQLRQFIDDALTITDTTGWAITPTPTVVSFNRPWPGVVDSTGIALYADFASGPASIPAVLTAPDGTYVDLGATDWGTGGQWKFDKSTFSGITAGGNWSLSLTCATSRVLNELRLVVSNDIDSAQIYNFFCFVDPIESPTPDLAEGQRLFRQMSLAHMNAKVCQTLAFTVDDPYSLVDRDPVGV